ncbi:hypothetical protein DV515_00016658 [Chloebia gouldiae]|uniref:Uncharacterized protein n=1 Tax=Chloebia gouldiae TaxID=44316 RepID=A0A3L8RSB2_CHLGU|nr:hypothetical protein DV515_00016658 [Chloebia gouldiae]
MGRIQHQAGKDVTAPNKLPESPAQGHLGSGSEMGANILVVLPMSDKPFWVLGIKMELGALQREEQETMGSETHWLDSR